MEGRKNPHDEEYHHLSKIKRVLDEEEDPLTVLSLGRTAQDPFIPSPPPLYQQILSQSPSSASLNYLQELVSSVEATNTSSEEEPLIDQRHPPLTTALSLSNGSNTAAYTWPVEKQISQSRSPFPPNLSGYHSQSPSFPPPVYSQEHVYNSAPASDAPVSGGGPPHVGLVRRKRTRSPYSVPLIHSQEHVYSTAPAAAAPVSGNDTPHVGRARRNPTQSSPSSAPLVYLQENVSLAAPEAAAPVSGSVGRERRNPTHAPREGKSDTIPPPFEWATNHRAKVHNLNYLLSNQILTIRGEVQCKRCERQFEIEYDLQEKFREIGSFIAENKDSFHDRAQEVWKNPVLPKCRYCDQDNSAKPVIAKKKKSINWLFLFLGQMLGCCTIEQLKYFCKHTHCHRTGAKDRVLFSTYLGIWKQLEPNGPFNR